MSTVTANAEVINEGKQYTSNVQINQHELIADEPIENGGEDMGPAPADYLCAALASCIAITLRMYAGRKKWKVDRIKVSVELIKNDKNDKNAPGQNTFLCELNLTGNLDEEQLKRLKVISDSCPLHILLGKPNEIVTKLAYENHS